MTVTVQKFQGNRPRIDRKYWTTSVTRQGVTTTARTTMDQKEIEDRMAAAEALSSLGLPATFPGLGIAMPAVTIPQGDSASAAEKTPSSKGRTKDRSGGKSDQRDTGRESKSRSNRGGRGRGRSSSAVATAVVTTATPTSVALNVPQVAVPHVLPLAALPSGQLGHLTFSSVSANDPAHVQAVLAPNSNARGRRRNSKNAGKEQSSQSQTVTSQQQQQTVLRGGPGIAFHVTGSQGFESTLADRTNLRSGANLLPLVSVSTLATGQINASDAERPPRIMPDSQSKPVAVVLPASVATSCLTTSAAVPAAGSLTESLPSLPSCVGLPSVSLGSLGLQSLPSLPNLPSLPSAIASLQLNSTGQTPLSPDSFGPESQLSPLPRDNGEKSLPLKKRKIVDSTSPPISLATSTPSLPVTSLCASSAITASSYIGLPTPALVPIPQTPQTETGTVTKVDAPSTSASEERPDSEKQLEKPAQVVSPGPTPAALLSQVLPPAVSLQLLSEINTAITPDEDGDLPLHIAVVHENDMMVKKLIQLMGLVYRSVDRYNKQQQTPLHLAIKLAYLPGIKMLLETGADPNLVDSSGSTSIHMAVQGRDPDCLEALLQWSKHKCDLNYRNFEGMAPLHTAVVNNDIELVKKLLDHGADINVMDGKSGRTVLFHAAEGNRKAIVELLLRRGADPEIANYAGVIPTMAAQGRSHTNVARILARAVDEGLDDGAEDMEIQSPPALEIAMSEDSSDSSKPVSVDKVKGSSMADVLSDMAARVSSAQLQARGHPLPSSKDPMPLQGQTAPAARGEASPSVATATSQPGLKLPFQSVLQTVSVEEDGRSDKDVKAGTSDGAPAVFSQKNLLQATPAMKDQPSVHEEVGGTRLNIGPLGPGTVAADVDENGVPQASLAKVIQNLIIKAWTEKQNGGDHAEGRETLRPVVTSVGDTTLPARLSGLKSASPPISQVSTAATISAEQGSKPMAIPPLGQSAVKVASLPGVMNTAGFSPASVSEKAGSALPAPLPSAAHAQVTRPLLLFRSSSSDPSGTSGVSMELRHVTADTLLALRQSPTNSVRPNLNTQPPTFQHLRSFLASSGIPLPRVKTAPLENNQSTPVPNHITSGNFGTVKVLYESDDVADQPKDYSLKSRKDEGSSAVKLDPGPFENCSGSKEHVIKSSYHSKQTSAIKTTSSPLVGQTRISGKDPKNPEKAKKTKSKATRSKQNAKEEKVKKESKLIPQTTLAGVSSLAVHGESGLVANLHNSRLTNKTPFESAEAQTSPMLVFTTQQSAVTERTDSWSSASAEQPMETG